MKPEAYQENRQTLLTKLEALSAIRSKLVVDFPNLYNDIPSLVREKLHSIDKDILRLQDPNLKIAFVGGFSAGKSSLVNAFLGRYLLPESTQATTAIPTFVRSCGTEDERAEIHFLSQSGVKEIEQLFREEVSEAFNRRDLLRASDNEFLNFIKEHREEGRGIEFLHLISFLENKHSFNNFNKILPASIQQAKEEVTDEKRAVFIDHVEFRIKLDIPQDIILVDLPGISVSNPRHRKITFDFIENKANAIIFVLLADRLFDRDETKIMESVRSGGQAIAQRTFWVINKWDTLRDHQVNRERTLTDFKKKMEEFKIPNYQFFKTNALHGLIAQLLQKDAFEQEGDLDKHIDDYKRTLKSRYNSSNDEALNSSEIPLLQENVFTFLNEEIRPATISSTVENARQNFIRPLVNQLRRKKEQYDESLDVKISSEKELEIKQRTEEQVSQRLKEIGNLVTRLVEEVAEKRKGIFSVEVQGLFDDLENRIKQDKMTDAFQQYLSIIGGGGPNSLRKFPYFFEIEIKIVDSLNSTLKTGFREKVLDECKQIMSHLTKELDSFFEDIASDVRYELANINQLKQSAINSDQLFTEMEGVVKAQVFSLDELLIFKRQDLPKAQQLLRGALGIKKDENANQLIEALIEIAKVDSVIDHQVSRPNMEKKTEQIRDILTKLYLPRVDSYRDQFIDNAWGLIIAHIKTIGNNLTEVVRVEYRRLLETIITNTVTEELGRKRKLIDEQSKRLGQEVDLLEMIESDLRKLLTST